MTMRAECSAALNQASTPSLSSTGGPIAGKEPLKGAARVTAAGLSRSSLLTASVPVVYTWALRFSWTGTLLETKTLTLTHLNLHLHWGLVNPYSKMQARAIEAMRMGPEAH